MKKTVAFFFAVIIVVSLLSITAFADLNKEYISEIRLYSCYSDPASPSTRTLNSLCLYATEKEFTPVKYDINGSGDSRCIIISNKTSQDEEKAITNIMVSYTCDETVIDSIGCVYYPIGSYSVTSFTEQYPDSPMNISDSSSKPIYLYYTTDKAYSPISKLSFEINSTGADTDYVTDTNNEIVSFNSNYSVNSIVLKTDRYNDISFSGVFGNGFLAFTVFGFAIIILCVIFSTVAVIHKKNSDEEKNKRA